MSVHWWRSRVHVLVHLRMAQDSSMMMTTSNPQWASWDTRTASPVDSTGTGKAVIAVAIVIIVVVVLVSHDAAAEDRAGGDVALLSLLWLSSSPLAAAVLSLIPPLNICRLIVTQSHPGRFTTPVPYHQHCPPVCAHPTTFCCHLPPLLIVEFPL